MSKTLALRTAKKRRTQILTPPDLQKAIQRAFQSRRYSGERFIFNHAGKTYSLEPNKSVREWVYPGRPGRLVGKYKNLYIA